MHRCVILVPIGALGVADKKVAESRVSTFLDVDPKDTSVETAIL